MAIRSMAAMAGSLAGGVALLSAAVAAQAQTAGQPVRSATEAGLEEITVTARRRVESLENVPAAISAINAESLIKQGIRTDADLQAAVPGLVIRNAASTNFINYVMRGQSLDQYSGSVPGVQPYVNEVPFMPNAATSFFDLESVQVLKGPQGTLFGRNLIGGAVLYQTAQPGPDFGGYASVQYGNFDRLVAEAAVNLPVSDRLAFRLAGTHTSGGAFIRNLYDNKKYGDREVDAGRLSMSLDFDTLVNTTVVEFTSSGGTNQPLKAYYVLPCGPEGGSAITCGLDPSVPAFQELINSAPGTYYPGYPGGYVFPGGTAALPAFLDSIGDYVVNQNAPFDHDTDYGYVTNTTTWDVSSNITIKNIFGYSESDAEDGFDNDASPYPTIDPGLGMPGDTEFYRVQARQFSNELQLQGRGMDERLTYIVGAFYVNTRSEFDSAIRQVLLFPPTTIFPLAYRFHGITRDESYAVFTQGTYAFTDKLNVTAGVRWTWDKLSTKHLPDSIFYTGSFTQEAWQDEPSWTLSVDYRLNSDLMVYATTRGSWRVGGYNLFAPPVGDKLTADAGGNYFLPETVRDVEVGAKFNGDPGGIPVRANLAVYHQWMEDIQRVGLGVIAGTSASATVTVPSARVSGLELDFELRPADWLRIGGSYVHTRARFKDNVGYLYGIPSYFGPYGDTPRNSGTLFGEVTAPLANELGRLTYRVDAFSQSSFYFSNRANTFDPGTKIDAYTLVNMRLEWDDPFQARGLTIGAFVKNLGDELYYTGGAPGAQVAGLVSAVYGLPRTYGVDLRFRW